MDKVIVAAVQQKMRLPADLAEFERDARRFLRIAQVKGAQLIVFPELSGMMAAPPLLKGLRANLLKQADRGRQRRSSFWTRAKSRVAAGTIGLLGSDFDRELVRLFDRDQNGLWDSYEELFSRLAQETGATIVAGSVYSADSHDGAIRNVATVFGPLGNVLGQQARVVTTAENGSMTQPGDGWAAISTPVGRIGLLVGPDVLYPETARILAYQGAEMFIGLGACTTPALYHRMRSAMQARVQENQLYGLMSFLIGHNPFTAGETQPFVGRSGIYAPAEFTHRYSGIMVETGTDKTEGLITAEWDFTALRQLWETSVVPVRRTIPLRVAAPILTSIYERGVMELPSPEDMLPLLAGTPQSGPPAAPAQKRLAETLPPVEIAETPPQSAAPPVAVSEPVGRPLPPAPAVDETPTPPADDSTVLYAGALPVVGVSEGPSRGAPAAAGDEAAAEEEAGVSLDPVDAADDPAQPLRWPWQRKP